MSFAIKQGLFKLNITDHHAILGVSIDAEAKQIRMQYLKIAQQLHPDKCRSDAAKARIAEQILSRLVNPAYEQLSRKTAFAEHQLVLTQIGKRLAENKNNISVKSQSAQELLKAGDSAGLVYPKLLKQLTVDQYQSLAQSGELIEAISELNLVYLMLKSDRGINPIRIQTTPPTAKPNPETVSSKTTLSQEPDTVASSSVEEPTTDSRVNAFINRAQQYISKAEFDQAIQELKDALRIDPNHGVVHAVMGRAYLHKKQLTMAKVHIDKAFQAQPHNEIVMESKKALDKLSRAGSKSQTSHPGTDSKSANQNNKPGNSGFFSGFFGAKKK
jgi:tetratricopeptide (TPR) repeat protein